ncbi:MAG: DUF4252 domain-containing protein [Bacteroidota bacterium]
MHKYIQTLILIVALSPLGAFAQSPAISKFFDTYRDEEDYTLIDIHGSLFNMFSDKEMKQKKSKIQHIRLLSAPKDKGNLRASDIRSLTNAIKQVDYEDLVTIRDQDTRINFMVLEKGDLIKELLMVVNEPDSFTIMTIMGNLHKDELEDLLDDIEIEGSEHLKKIDKN